MVYLLQNVQLERSFYRTFLLHCHLHSSFQSSLATWVSLFPLLLRCLSQTSWGYYLARWTLHLSRKIPYASPLTRIYCATSLSFSSLSIRGSYTPGTLGSRSSSEPVKHSTWKSASQFSIENYALSPCFQSCLEVSSGWEFCSNVLSMDAELLQQLCNALWCWTWLSARRCSWQEARDGKGRWIIRA